MIHGISITIREGASVGIVGESGSGKSQTALSVLKLLRGTPGITSGVIEFDGLDLVSVRNKEMEQIRGHEIAIIFQDAKASLIPYMTIEEQVMDTQKSLGEGRSSHEMKKTARKLLREMNFSDSDRIMSSYPNQLSGGECQRAYIMLTLLGNPRLLIADEPTSSLDPVTSYQLINLLKQICSRRNIALVLISHDLAEVIRVTDYIYVFYDGHVVEEFPADWLREDKLKPVHPYTRFLFSMFKGEAFAELKEKSQKKIVLPETEQHEDYGQDDGCIYASRCDLKNKLDEGLQEKCFKKHPKLEPEREEGKVACWGSEKMNNEHAEN